ncbi:hypothetical protein [Alloactinosynnema sp. L-07]|uniref:hypothetical protein n=1 Tax=Alloactinosynnema sp. L-07 TaxID=1653480 RepID=UPI0006B49AF6|nr:hypothetical protein [Alloactinosynnema sp. L-07]
MPDVLVLSHDEQADRLADSVPEAVDRAVVVGDPRFDRMLASRPRRPGFRAALGVGDDDVFVVVSTTWWSRSLFGTWPDLLRQLIAELPVDGYRVAAVLHPHIWHEHGPGQVALWLADCLRSGLILIPPAEGWAAALIASDVVIGDHGAVTCYGAALDKPVLLAAFPTEDVAVGSCVEQLGLVASPLIRGRDLRGQVDRAVADHEPGSYGEVVDLVSAYPGEAAARLRALCYGVMGLPEPPGPVVVPLLAEPSALWAPYAAVRVSGDPTDTDAVRLRRHPADALQNRESARPVLDDAHLVVEAGHQVPVIRGNADIVFTRDTSSAGDWLRAATVEHPFARIVAVVSGKDCVAAVSEGPVVELTHTEGARLDPLAAVSALYVWLAHQTADTPPPSQLRVRADRSGEAVFTIKESELFGPRIT